MLVNEHKAHTTSCDSAQNQIVEVLTLFKQPADINEKRISKITKIPTGYEYLLKLELTWYILKVFIFCGLTVFNLLLCVSKCVQGRGLHFIGGPGRLKIIHCILKDNSLVNSFTLKRSGSDLPSVLTRISKLRPFLPNWENLEVATGMF